MLNNWKEKSLILVKRPRGNMTWDKRSRNIQGR